MLQRLMQTQTQQSQLLQTQATTAAAPTDADQLINQLNEKIKAKDEKGVAALLTTAQTKMAELDTEGSKGRHRSISENSAVDDRVIQRTFKRL